jgi:ribosomal protein L11 methyltransferase
MTDIRTLKKSSQDLPEPPYKDLFIYYLKGLAPTNDICFGKTFVGTWQEEDFSFLFFTEPSHDKVNKFLSCHSHLTLIDTYHMTYDDWQGGAVGPDRFGGFFITPPWILSEDTFATEKLPIILDPGVVFGAGNHPTTRSCLRALEVAFRHDGFETALDLGTGTGLLAVAAKRLGCEHVIAVDLNPLAVKTAQRNIRLNRQEDSVVAILGKAQDFVTLATDLVIANIHYAVMKDLIDSDGFYAKKGFILSGLLRSQAKEIIAQLSNKPVKIIKTWETEGVWHTFFGKIA